MSTINSSTSGNYQDLMGGLYPSLPSNNAYISVLPSPGEMVDPRSYRVNPNDLYQPPVNQTVLEASELNELKNVIPNSMTGFYPTSIDLNHPIHKELDGIVRKIIEKSATKSELELPAFYEAAIAEVANSGISFEPKEYLKSLKRVELLEIAIRAHLFCALLSKLHEKISSTFNSSTKFPKNLKAEEILILNIASHLEFISGNNP